MSLRPHRRAVLRGLLGGAAVTLALPPLEALLGRGASASSGAFPKRFVLFFWGNGIKPERWIPPDAGPDWTLTEQLAPLAPVKDVVTLVTGTEVKTGNADAHISGPAGFLTGHAAVAKGGGDWTFAGPSLDQIIAAERGGDTLFRSLEVGVQPGARGMSHNGPDSINPPETDLIRLFERLFGPTFRVPGENSAPDPTLALRRSVLDSVMADSRKLRARLGAFDRNRLDLHFNAVRDLELRIARLQQDPPALAACARPAAPPDLPLVEGRPLMSERAKVASDLLAMALACDQTRVASLWYSDPVSDVLYPGTTAGHHQLTHDEPPEQPQVNAIVVQIMGDLAYLVSALRAVPEGDGTLLDSTALLATTDVSEGRTHQINEYPIILAGKACGALRSGFHYRSETQESTSQVALSLLRALDVRAATFGAEAGETDRGLSEIES